MVDAGFVELVLFPNFL